ncbi:MAG: DUF4124 domain-containing protein [Myxococcota bacterium]
MPREPHPLRRSASVLLALGLCALPCVALADETHRWVDAAGRVHFGSAPPSVGVLGPASRAPGDSSEPESIGGRTEPGWRREALRLLKQIDSRQERIERIEAELGFPSRYRSGVGTARHEARQRRRIEELGREIAEVEEQLEELRRHARRLGVPPGWLR